MLTFTCFCREKSEIVLIAFESDLLVFIIFDSNPRVLSTPLLNKFEIFAMKFGIMPFWVVVAYSETTKIWSPWFKRNIEFTNILKTISGLFSIFISPKLGFLGPWTIVLVNSPWVSHFNDFLSVMSTSFKLNCSKNTITMTWNHIMMGYKAWSSHCEMMSKRMLNVIPKHFIIHLGGVICLSWHTGESPHSFVYISTVQISVADIEFSYCFLKSHQPIAIICWLSIIQIWTK